jgi:hypothetical protein
LSQKLSLADANIPAVQTFFAYVILTIVWVPITMYRYGIKRFGNMVWQHGWKCQYYTLLLCPLAMALSCSSLTDLSAIRLDPLLLRR